MAILKNLTAFELLVQLAKKRHLKLAPAGDPGDAKEVEDQFLLPDRAEGKVIEDLVRAGRLSIVPGSQGVGLSSVAVGQEQYPGLRGYDVVVDLEGAAGVDVPAGPAIPAGAFLLSVQANIEEEVVAGGTSTNVGIGVGAAAPDQYGLTGDLLKNSKPAGEFFRAAALAALGAPETLNVSLVTGAGAAGDTAPTAGKVRVRAQWLEAPGPLPDAL